MKTGNVIQRIVLLVLIMLLGLATGNSLGQDIEVIIRQANGKTDTFSKEVASMEIVMAPGGEIRYIHLILMTNGEKDTHCWYNYANLTSLQYRFLAVTGKGKVNVRQIDQFDTVNEAGVPAKVPVIRPDDYK
ncbi:MAG: hypothetical protein A2340_00785 [Lentisphaerae bacterium RIFOXYB12_FULL_60_10]|nr:MAG: hypothetical protein A2269_01400 [Lentisphaerae bacterium RIFOXYA12_FULL_60_10]OGV79929.1 MAG: hypothetical protein A2340_00785 [Lentisphaerae bacterium RIFOXYB12_FULL_60_10]